jgi:membrane protein implicated in regulation of membrane protease activity
MHERALRIHALAHPIAWIGVGAAIATGLPLVGAVAVFAGLAGSVAFAVFYAHLVRRVRAPIDPARSSP